MKAKKYYRQYEPGTSLSTAFEDDSLIPLMTMENLRNLDFQISRSISYERTVDEFLIQLAVNDSLRAIKRRENLVILLNEEGALVRDSGKWVLYFTPGQTELLTLKENDDLYNVMKDIEAKAKAGEISMVDVPERSQKTLVSETSPFSILDEYCKKQPGRYLNVAMEIVRCGPEKLYKNVPVCRYNHLETVDKDEIENYNTIRMLLDDYVTQCVNADHGERIQPLSIAVFGYPGSGKSFGVKQIAATSGMFETRSINLSQYEDPKEFFEALDEALSGAAGKIPLIFFDEFDSELNGCSRGWLKYFLAPMQDGEYSLRGKVRYIERAVLVFAGGTAHTFREFMPGEDEEKKQIFAKLKGPDFVSRLKGILNIKGLNPDTATDRSHIIRRAMLLRQLMVKSAPSICDSESGRVSVSGALLSALLRVSVYRHGARSLEYILAMCRLSGVKRFTPSSLPMDDQLDLHVDVEDFRCKLLFEQIMGNAVERYAETAHALYRSRYLEEQHMILNEEDFQLLVCKDREMADWSHLDEFYKEGYRSRIRYIGEYLVSYRTNIGIRPIIPSSPDAIRELYGPALEELSRVEHERWVKDKQEDGWRYGSRNSELKTSPELLPFDQLSEETRDLIRKEVREMPVLLEQIGYELYHKAY